MYPASFPCDLGGRGGEAGQFMPNSVEEGVVMFWVAERIFLGAPELREGTDAISEHLQTTEEQEMNELQFT